MSCTKDEDKKEWDFEAAVASSTHFHLTRATYFIGEKLPQKATTTTKATQPSLKKAQAKAVAAHHFAAETDYKEVLNVAIGGDAAVMMNLGGCELPTKKDKEKKVGKNIMHLLK